MECCIVAEVHFEFSKGCWLAGSTEVHISKIKWHDLLGSVCVSQELIEDVEIGSNEACHKSEMIDTEYLGRFCEGVLNDIGIVMSLPAGRYF